MTIEVVDLVPDLDDKVSLEKGLEVLRIRLFGLRKHALINELINGPPLHFAELKMVSVTRFPCCRSQPI